MGTKNNVKHNFRNYLFDSIGEFLDALRIPYTYSFFGNPYFFFGFLWGLPIPFFIFGTHLLLEGNNISIAQALTLLEQHSWLWIFPFHPLIFGVVFGALGTIRLQKQDDMDSLIETLKSSANTDNLTGLFNRGYFMSVFEKEFVRSERNDGIFSIILFDIDNFKKVNDQYGHNQGDEVLRQISYVFKEHSRVYDTTCRWGGEEFAMLLPGTKQKDAVVIANRIRISFEQQIFTKKGKHFCCSISAGVTEFNRDESGNPDKLIDQADQALYQAKDTGKNCVKVFDCVRNSRKKNFRQPSTMV
jgi:diguanylate cyclase (GGDEF)-like protein